MLLHRCVIYVDGRLCLSGSIFLDNDVLNNLSSKAANDQLEKTRQRNFDIPSLLSIGADVKSRRFPHMGLILICNGRLPETQQSFGTLLRQTAKGNNDFQRGTPHRR